MKRVLFENGHNCIAAVKHCQTLDTRLQRMMYMMSKISVPDLPGQTNNRFLGANRHQRNFSTERLWIDEEKNCMYFVRDVHTVMLSTHGKIFTTKKWDLGFTVNLKNGITKFWGSTKFEKLNSEVVNQLFTATGNEWVITSGRDALNGDLRYWLSNATVKRILRKKITNPEQLVKDVLKTNTRYKYLDIAHRAKSISKLLKKGEDDYRHRRQWDNAYQLLKVCTKKDYVIDMVLQGSFTHEKFPILEFPHYGDLMRQLIITGDKIDPTWSLSRLNSLHNELSGELRNVELIGMVNHTYGYDIDGSIAGDYVGLPMLRGMSIIKDTHSLLNEGKVMNHCIGGYKNDALHRELFHFHCKLHGGSGLEFSLAIKHISYTDDDGTEYSRFDVQQMYRRHNGRCASYEHNAIRRWVKHPTVQQWFKAERRRYKDIVDKHPNAYADHGHALHQELTQAGINVAEENAFEGMLLSSQPPMPLPPAPLDDEGFDLPF